MVNGLPKLLVLRYLSANGMHDSHYSAMSFFYFIHMPTFVKKNIEHTKISYERIIF